MSFQKIPQEDYPPPGYGTIYPPPQPSAPPESPPRYSYPPPRPPRPSGYPYQHNPQHGGGGYQGYFNQGYSYPPPRPPTQAYHCDHYHHDPASDSTSFLRGCLAALCCCCVLEECCF